MRWSYIIAGAVFFIMGFIAVVIAIIILGNNNLINFGNVAYLCPLLTSLRQDDWLYLAECSSRIDTFAYIIIFIGAVMVLFGLIIGTYGLIAKENPEQRTPVNEKSKQS
ncbi:MAG: hypothetical protein NT130_02820 [Candidatus Micrarchaeota archaeon]|nr:hypothetical protein [Candidatus Micrarchaeota archaeon]